MATIYRLVTQLAADPAPMKAGFDRGLAITKEFARAAAKAIGDVPKNTGEGFVAAGTQAAIDLLDALNKTYAARQTELLEAFARGSLSKGQFAELGDEAAKSFNTALLNGITKLDKKKAIPPEARAALVNSLQETGIAASDAFENGLTTIGSKTRSLGRDLTQIGRELSIGLTAPIAAGAIAAIAASNIFEHAIDDIRVATGKVGPSLDEMEGHLRTLFTQLPNSAADIGHALQIITQFTGASGDQLDALATQALNLSRITGSDLASGLTTAQHAFQGFNVSTKDQLGAMDTLFKTSQQTGVAVGDLAGNLAQFAPAFRQLGLGFGQSAALLGQFTKEGLNADAIITTLQNSLSKFALKGVDTSSALTLVIDSLKKAGSDAEAINLASRIFGPREAVQISTAARNGSLDIQKLTDSVRISAITINGVADQTDTFATALDKVGKAAGVVTATVGDQLKASFLQIAPALLEALDDITHLVKAFTELPRPVGVFLEVIAGLLAVLGPAALLFGGVAKAIGSTVLAFGLLKDAKVAAAVSDVGTAGLAASGALSEAGEAAVKLGLGLKALQTSTVIGLGLAALAAVLLLVTHQFRDAKEKLDAFKTSLQGLSNSELELKTTKLQKDIDDRQKQIDALAKSVADANATNVTAGRFAATPGPKDPNAIANTSLQFMRDNQRAAVDSLAAVGLQFKDNGEQAEIAAQKQELYFKAVFAGIKQFSGKSSVSIDPTGSIKGTVADLEKEAGLMQQALDNGFTSPRISADELRSGMERLQRQAAALKNGSKGIGDIFDQESPGITNLGLAISGTLGHLKQFGNAFEQLAQTGSTNSVLRNLALVNAALEHTGNSSKIDVQRLREFKSQLDASLAAQLTSNTDNSHAYRVDVIGNVKKIEIDSSQTGIVLAGFQDGLRKVHDDAEEAAVATLNLQRATASGNLFAIRDATTASQAAFSKLNDEANRYKGLVGTSGQSLTDQQHALAQLDETMKKLNVDTSLVHGFTISAEDIAAIGPEFQRILARIPPLKIPVTVDSMAGAQAADTAAAAIQKSLFNALAGGGGTTVANERTAILNKFAREQAKIAQDAVKPGGIGAANAMTEIAANAKAAGFSVEELAKAMEHLSTRGQITGIADNFAAVASAIFGANSAMSQFAQSIKAGVDGFFQLKDAIAALKSGGGSFADVFSGVTSVATAVVGAIGIVSKLFGKSQLDVEHDNILKQNNSALATLTNTLDRQAGTAERTAQLTQGLTAVSADLKTLQTGKGQFDDTFKNAFQKALDANGGNPAAVNIATTAGVTAELLKFHLTIAQATAAAKALNITLVDSKGNFTGLDAFMTALGENATILTSLASDLSTTQKLTAVKESLQGGKVTAQQKLQDSVGDIIKTIGNANSTVTQQLTAGLAGGPQALRAAFQKIVDEIQAGSLSLSDLGGLTDVSQLLDAIGGTSDALNALTGASNNLLGALVNVPSGFKKALDEFNAGAVSAGPPTAPTPPNPTPTPPFTGAPGTEPGAHDPTTIHANFAKQLQSALSPAGSAGTNTLVTATKQLGDSTTDAGTAIAGISALLAGLIQPTTTAGKSLSGVLAAFGGITPVAGAADKSLSDVLDTFTALPANVDVLTASLTNLLAAIQQGISIPAPTFHVKQQSANLTIAAPNITVQPLRGVHLNAPTVTIGTPAPLTVRAPVVTVAEFKPVALDTPPLSVTPFASVVMAAPPISVSMAAPIVIPAPTVTLSQATPSALTVAPPTVSLTRPLSPVVVQPPLASVSAYTGTRAIAPPTVHVGALASLQLSAPKVSVPPLSPVRVASPSVTVGTLPPLKLSAPPVSVKPFNPVVLKAPTVVLPPTRPVSDPLPQQPIRQTGLPGGGTLTPELMRALADAVTNATTPTPTAPDVHLHGDVFVDARDKTAAQLFTAVKSEIQKVARQKTGDSTQVLTALQQ